MSIRFFSFLFFPLSSHSFMLSSSSFQSIVLEFVVLNSARAISHYIWYVCEVTLNHTAVIRIIWCTSVMTSHSAFKCCDSLLSGIHLSVERSPVYFSFNILTLWNLYKVRLFRAKAGHMMSNTLGSLFYLSPKILEVLLQGINCTHVLSFSLVRSRQRILQGCLCSGWT